MSPLVKAQQEFAVDVAKLILQIEAEGFACTFGEAFRPPELQEIYLAQGRSWTDKSRHLDRRAIDLNLFDGGHYVTDETVYAQFGLWWEALRPGKNKWGAGNATPRRRDANHFSRDVF